MPRTREPRAARARRPCPRRAARGRRAPRRSIAEPAEVGRRVHVGLHLVAGLAARLHPVPGAELLRLAEPRELPLLDGERRLARPAQVAVDAGRLDGVDQLGEVRGRPLEPPTWSGRSRCRASSPCVSAPSAKPPLRPSRRARLCSASSTTTSRPGFRSTARRRRPEPREAGADQTRSAPSPPRRVGAVGASARSSQYEVARRRGARSNRGIRLRVAGAHTRSARRRRSITSAAAATSPRNASASAGRGALAQGGVAEQRSTPPCSSSSSNA